MGIGVEFVDCGGPTLVALSRLVRDAQRDDPLAPVTVVVPSRTVGVALRRAVATAAASRGLAGVRFEVLPRVAELLGAPVLAGRRLRPLRPAAHAEAVRVALAERPGAFRRVADHPATARALVRTLEELREAPPHALGLLRGPRGRDLAALAARVRELTAGRYDAVDLMLAAAETLASGGAALGDLGRVVALVTDPPGGPARELLRALGARTDVRVLVPVTGDAADADLREAVAGLGAAAEPGPRAGAVPPADLIVSAPDPHTEVRDAIGLIAERFHAGTPLHRMALLWTAARPYALLVRDELAAAGLPASGLPGATLAQTPSGRALHGLLRLASGRLERDEVAHWLNAAPVRASAGGPEADAARWDAVSRRAGVVRDLAQWRDRLERYAWEERARAAAAERDDDAGRARHHGADADQADGLRVFVDELAGALRAPAGSWARLAAWTEALLDRYVGEPRAHWSDDDVAADRAVRRVLRELAELDELGTRPDLAAFRRAVDTELEQPHGTGTRLGQGLVTGGVRAAAGHDLDLVVVVGLVEGLAPARVRDDAVLPDRERRRLPDVPLRAARPAVQRRAFVSALASARERILCASRSDPRGGRERIPSRWLLEAAGGREGRPVHSEDLAALRGRPWLRWLASFPQSVRAFPAGEPALDLALLDGWRAAGRPLRSHPLATGRLGRGLDAQRDRTEGRFGPWTGLVGPRPSLALGDRPVSPTRLESWAACPFRYLLERVLDVEQVERPEETVRIDPRHRGRLVHRVLERFLTEGEAPPPGLPWPPARRARLHEIAEEECGRAERQGLTGKALLWRLERERLHRQLDAFLDGEPALRGADGTTPLAVEAAFGFDGSAPALELADGRRVGFRGFVDRIDRSPDGAVVVVDYKTGRDGPYRDALARDPVGLGQLLQLPVYALAAEALTGEAPERVRSAYWFLTDDGPREVAWSATPRELGAFRTAVDVVVSGIEAGHYPQRPGEAALSSRANCDTCAFALACDRDRERRWRRVRSLPELAGLARLEEGAAAATEDLAAAGSEGTP